MREDEEDKNNHTPTISIELVDAGERVDTNSAELCDARAMVHFHLSIHVEHSVSDLCSP